VELGEAGAVRPSVYESGESGIAGGAGHLFVERVGGESAATSFSAASPLKLLVPRPRGESVWAYLSSLGGGFVAGDQTGMEVKLAAETRCFISTQASTKVYRNPQRRPCGHRMSVQMGAQSWLASVPDPVQPFAGSSYRQEQVFHLHPTSNLVLVDWVTSGRAARGERWEFDDYRSRNDLHVGGERILIDALSLNPIDDPVSGVHRMGRYNCLALVVFLGEGLMEESERILAEVASMRVERRAALVSSASPLKSGVLLRLAGESVQEVTREVHRRLGFLAGVLGDDPLARKW